MGKRHWLLIVLAMNLGVLHSAAYGSLAREPLMQPTGLYGAASDAASAMASKAYNVAQSVLPSTVPPVAPEVKSSALTGAYHASVNAASALASGAYHAGQYAAQSYQGLGDTGKKAVQLAAAGAAAYGGLKWYQRRQALSAQQEKFRAENAFYLMGEGQYKTTMRSVEDLLKREKARLDKSVDDFLRAYNAPYVRMKALLVEMQRTDAMAQSLLQKLQAKNPQPVNAAAIDAELKGIRTRNRQMRTSIERYIQTIDAKWKKLLDNIKDLTDHIQQNPIETYQDQQNGPVKNALSLDDPLLSIHNNLVTYDNDHSNHLGIIAKHKNI